MGSGIFGAMDIGNNIKKLTIKQSQFSICKSLLWCFFLHNNDLHRMIMGGIESQVLELSKIYRFQTKLFYSDIWPFLVMIFYFDLHHYIMFYRDKQYYMPQLYFIVIILNSLKLSLVNWKGALEAIVCLIVKIGHWRKCLT